MLRPRPTELPAEVWGIASQLLRGRTDIDRYYAIHVGEATASFALGKAFPTDGSVPAMAGTGDISREEAAECCDDLAAKKVRGFNWAALAKKLLEVLLPLIVR
jgi:hypothetical protein